MDMITLAMAKAYTDSKQLAYSEPGKTLLDVALTDGRKVVDYKIGLEVGKTYTVTTDSGTYTAVCKSIMDVVPYLGNLSLLYEEMENTGETFVVSEYMEDANVIVTAVDQNGGSYIKVSQPETIVPIDQKYLPEGGVGYSEPGKVYTFDGNAEETKKYGNITYAKIADTAPNLHNVTKAVYTAPNGSTIEYSSEKLTVEDLGSGQMINASLGSTTGAVIILDNTGLWVYAQPGYGYCSLIEFAEIIHPIDQKFIPPVDSLTINGTDGKQYKLTISGGSLNIAEVV